MSEEKIHTKVSCQQCKNFLDYGYAFEGVEVTDCDLGRYKEHTYAEQHGYITECEYWEAKECHWNQ